MQNARRRCLRDSYGQIVLKGVGIHDGQIGDGLGAMDGNVHADLHHDLNDARVETVGFDAGGEGLDPIALMGADPALGHLAAAGVPGSEKQDADQVSTPVPRTDSAEIENSCMADMEPFST